MGPIKPAWRLGLYTLLGLYIASIFFFALKPLLGWPIPPMLGPLSTVLVWAFALGHALYTLGGRLALAFFAIAFLVGMTFEAAGVATGWIYGGYYYSRRFGPMVLDVPVLVPASWFMVVYLAQRVTQRLTGGPGPSKSLARALPICFLGAVVATAWDVVADPQMARTGIWVWEQPGEFFGVPVQNFVGWLATSFVVLFLYSAVARRWSPRPWGARSAAFAALPAVAYGALALSFVVGYSLQGEGALAVVAFFTMGALSLAALIRA